MASKLQLTEHVKHLALNYDFFVPLLIPWMHELCSIASTKTLSESKQHRLFPESLLSFERIRDEIVPQLFTFLNSMPNCTSYLTKRFKNYISVDAKHINSRQMELFIFSLISDLISSVRSQHQFENNALNSITPWEMSIVIQYIILLIDEYNHSNENYVYNESICCQQFLTILNHTPTHQRLIQSHQQNVSDFSMYAQCLHDGANELKQCRMYIKQLEDKINTDARKENGIIHHTRPSSQSDPLHGQKLQSPAMSPLKPPSPMPIIKRIDIHTQPQPTPLDLNEIPPPPSPVPPPPPSEMWKPLEEMFHILEPHTKIEHKSIKPRLKYKIIPKKDSLKIKKPIKIKKVTYNISPQKSASDTPIFDGLESPAFDKISTTPGVVTFSDTVNHIKKKTKSKRRRQMTLSRPVKLESLSKDEFICKYMVESSHIIGQGSFAKIYQCKKKDQNTILAMKIVNKESANNQDVRAMRREISALSLITHQNVICIHDWCETSKHIFIVLDFCGGGNVFDRVIEQQTFSEMQVIKIIKQVGSALKYIHSLGIVHRDLKPENLMYVGPHDDNIKVIDFGLSNRIKLAFEQEDNVNPVDVYSLVTPCGTPHYAAPELILNEKYGAPVDLWALGVIIYLLLCGFPPFFDTDIKQMFKLIKRGKYSFPSPFFDSVSEEAKDLIRRLLVVDARQRYKAEQLLEHEWINDFDFECSNVIDELPLPFSPETCKVNEEFGDSNPYQSAISTKVPLKPLYSNRVSIDNNPQVDLDENQDIFSPSESVQIDQDVLCDNGAVFGTPIMDGNTSPLLETDGDDVDDMFELNLNDEKDESDIDKKRQRRVKTMTSNVAYMVDGTIFQMQKQQMNKLKIELERLRDELQIERRTLFEEKSAFERNKEIWMNEHETLVKLRKELDDVMVKYLQFQKTSAMADRDLFLKLDKEVLIKFCKSKQINTGDCFAKVDFVNVIIEKGYLYSHYTGKKNSKKKHLGLHDNKPKTNTLQQTIAVPTKLKKTATRFMLDADIDNEGDLDVAEFILAAKYLGSEVDNDELMETYLEHMENGGYENKTKPKQIIKDLMKKLDAKYHNEDYLDDDNGDDGVIKSQETSVYSVVKNNGDDVYTEDYCYDGDGTDIDIDLLAGQMKEQQLEIARNLMNISILNRYEIAEMTGCNPDDLKQFESESESEYESDSEDEDDDDTKTDIKEAVFDGVKVVGNKNNSIIINEAQCKQLQSLIDSGIDGISSNIEDTVTLLQILNNAINLTPGAMKRERTMIKLLSSKNVQQNVQKKENAFPIKYRVVIHPGALCKSRMDRKHPESKRVAELMQGTDVVVEEIVGNRARISSPNEGWISLKSSKSGTPIIERVDTKNQSKAMADAAKASKLRKTQLEIIKSVTTLSEKTCLRILEKSHWNTRIALDSFFRAKFMTQKYAKDENVQKDDKGKKGKKGWFKSWRAFAKSGNVNNKMIKKALKVIKRGKQENMQREEIESFLAEKGFTESDIAHAYDEYNKLNSASSKDDGSNAN